MLWKSVNWNLAHNCYELTIGICLQIRRLGLLATDKCWGIGAEIIRAHGILNKMSFFRLLFPGIVPGAKLACVCLDGNAAEYNILAMSRNYRRHLSCPNVCLMKKLSRISWNGLEYSASQQCENREPYASSTTLSATLTMFSRMCSSQSHCQVKHTKR